MTYVEDLAMREYGVPPLAFPMFAAYFEAGLPQSSICICGHPQFAHDEVGRYCRLSRNCCKCPNFNRVLEVKRPEYFFAAGIGNGPQHALHLSSLNHFARAGSLPVIQTSDAPWNRRCYKCGLTTQDLDPCVLTPSNKIPALVPTQGTITKWLCRDHSGVSSKLPPLQRILMSQKFAQD